ncbi:elongin-A-like isoform X3 [Pezoporus flaviventris]|uniref:elongin-A-like isoform X3 n=1 Tax=Pezoporus flaviventris TaxID=889875 RepID=UPI002AB169BF|nr:elongin-A-like isoform X3 [Pezoporus flaviventris]
MARRPLLQKGRARAEKPGRGREGPVAMAEGRSAARRVLELKERLGGAQEPDEIIETLEVLQNLDISLDILVETGIGKTVNSFKKHATAGNIAKTLVKQWKKLIPSEKKSTHRGRKQNTEKDETKSSVSKEVTPSEKSRASVLTSRSSDSAPDSKKLNKQHTCIEKIHQGTDSESQKECDNKECSNGNYEHASQGTNPRAKESDFKERTSTESKNFSEEQHSSVVDEDLPQLKKKPRRDASKKRNPKHVKKPKQKLVLKSKAKLSSDEEFEAPTMSFESYLTYDQVTKKRKRKAYSTGAQPKKCSEQKDSLLLQKTSNFSYVKEAEEDVKKCEDAQLEIPNKKAKVASLQDLLNTPLPKFLTDISISSPPYAADFKALHEVGGVPFEILEPVLTRCTPEQLLRIEECNPTFTEECDHLWKKHCQRDFKSKSLLEYESWREMYLRLFNQREEKLKTLTKNIISAQSEKPKGRQVKMAYMTSAAKPPRNIRRQQEIHGTAGPVTQLLPIEKCKTKIPESRNRNNVSSNPVPVGNSGSCSSSVVIQDGKKPIKKIAPIMKKTLRALKSRAGRR